MLGRSLAVSMILEVVPREQVAQSYLTAREESGGNARDRTLASELEACVDWKFNVSGRPCYVDQNSGGSPSKSSVGNVNMRVPVDENDVS